TASIATRCASITASTTSTIASASLFNTPLGAPQSVLLRHNENHGDDADGGCSGPTARPGVYRPSCAGTNSARLRRRFFCPQAQGGQLLRTSNRSHSRDGPVDSHFRTGSDKQIFGLNEQVRGQGSERLSGIGPRGECDTPNQGRSVPMLLVGIAFK